MKIFYLFILSVDNYRTNTVYIKNSNKMLIDVNTLIKKPILLKRTYIKTFHKKINKKIGCLSNQVKTIVFNSFRSFTYVSLEKSCHFKFGLTPNSCETLSVFYRYYFGRCSSELAELIPLLFSRGRSTRYCDRLHDFTVAILRCYNEVYVNSFFPHTAGLWNSLPIECFPLT